MKEGSSKCVHVFKCEECGKEFRLSDKDNELINNNEADGVYCCGGYCHEDRTEIEDADGNVTTVIV